MNSHASAILFEAMRLPEADRALIAQQLLQTLSPDVEDQADDELAAELDRRLEECEQDPTQGVSWFALRDEK